MHPVIQLLDKQCFLNNHVPVLVVQKIVKFFFFFMAASGIVAEACAEALSQSAVPVTLALETVKGRVRMNMVLCTAT